jgi:hypothetical protein
MNDGPAHFRFLPDLSGVAKHERVGDTATDWILHAQRDRSDLIAVEEIDGVETLEVIHAVRPESTLGDRMLLPKDRGSS